MDGFSDWVVASKGKRNIADTSGDLGVRKVFSNVLAGVDEIHCVIIMLIDSCSDGKNIGIENNVLRREAHFIHKDPIGFFTDFNLALLCIRLAFFVKGHHDDCGAVLHAQLCFFNKLLFAFLHADGINNAFTLDALQSRFYNFPFGGVDHNRHATNIGFRGDQI